MLQSWRHCRPEGPGRLARAAKARPGRCRPSRGSPLGEVVVDHGPGNSNSGYPDAATVAPATDPMPSPARPRPGRVASVGSLGPDQLGPASCATASFQVSWPIAATTTRGPRGWAWRVVVGRPRPPVACRALADQVEGAEAGHGLGDETACHTRLTSYGYTLDARSFVDGRRTATAPWPAVVQSSSHAWYFTRLPSIIRGRMRCEGSLRIGHPRSRNGGDRLTRRVLSRHLGHGTGQFGWRVSRPERQPVNVTSRSRSGAAVRSASPSSCAAPWSCRDDVPTRNNGTSLEH